MTPIVFHLGVVLLISAFALAPDVAAAVVGTGLAVCALVGFIYSVVIVLEMWHPKGLVPPHWSDIWCYAVLPAVLYLALAVTSALVWRVPPWVPYATGAVLVALLLLGIRNAWDLVTWLAPRRTGDEPNP
jgi:hypothetical protein